MARTINISPQKAYQLYISIFRKFLLISVPLAAFFYFVAPLGFVYVFGSRWEQSGIFIQYLAIAFLFDFISSPLGVTLDLTQRQDLMLVREFIRTILHFGSLIMSNLLGFQVDAAIVFFSLACSIGYIIHIFISWYAIKIHSGQEVGLN